MLDLSYRRGMSFTDADEKAIISNHKGYHLTPAKSFNPKRALVLENVVGRFGFKVAFGNTLRKRLCLFKGMILIASKPRAMI